MDLFTEDRVFKLKKLVRDGLQDLTPLRSCQDNELSEALIERRCLGIEAGQATVSFRAMDFPDATA